MASANVVNEKDEIIAKREALEEELQKKKAPVIPRAFLFPNESG